MILRRNLVIFCLDSGQWRGRQEKEEEIDRTCNKDYQLESNQECCSYAICITSSEWQRATARSKSNKNHLRSMISQIRDCYKVLVCPPEDASWHITETSEFYRSRVSTLMSMERQDRLQNRAGRLWEKSKSWEIELLTSITINERLSPPLMNNDVFSQFL